MKNKFLVFQAIGISIFVFFYFTKYYFDIFIYDTIYIISSFYIPLLILLIGNIYFFVKKVLVKR